MPKWRLDRKRQIKSLRSSRKRRRIANGSESGSMTGYWSLEQRRDARIQELTDGLVERERERQQRRSSPLQNGQRRRGQKRSNSMRTACRTSITNLLRVSGTSRVDSRRKSNRWNRGSLNVRRIVQMRLCVSRKKQPMRELPPTTTFTETMEGIYTDLVTAWDDP